MKPTGSISLDLDNLWAYMRAHGVDGWEKFPSYYAKVVPRVLGFCSERGIKLTVFVVGRDAEEPANIPWLQELVAAGHEIGNHSYMHEPWLHTYSLEKLQTELDRSESAIKNATAINARAFRGPGFGLSPILIEELGRRGYNYDASTLPTFAGPLARAMYFRSAKLSDAQRNTRKTQFGRFRDGFQPLKPYRWKVATGSLLELPVTTMPIFRTPMHFTYLHYLAQYSVGLANLYFRVALRLCRWFGVRPSILLHPLDFLAADDVPELKAFPGIGISGEKKLANLNGLFDVLQKRFELLPIGKVIPAHDTPLRIRNIPS